MRTINFSQTHTMTPPPEKYSSWRLWWDPWCFKDQRRNFLSLSHSLSFAKHKNNFFLLFLLVSRNIQKVLTVLAIFSCMGCIWKWMYVVLFSLCIYIAVLCLFFSITSHLCTIIHWTLELTSHPFMLSLTLFSIYANTFLCFFYFIEWFFVWYWTCWIFKDFFNFNLIFKRYLLYQGGLRKISITHIECIKKITQLKFFDLKKTQKKHIFSLSIIISNFEWKSH